MRKLKVNFAKIFLFILAIIMPISVTGVVGAFTNIYEKNVASAETSAINYYRNYIEDVSVTNNNFNSSTVTSISSNPSGWSRQVSDSRSTAGIINVGDNFDNYKNGTYYLSVNPSKKSSDSQILMINSKTSSSDVKLAREGYSSSSLTLSANSYYSFQVSFKSDTNYTEEVTYYPSGGSTGVANDVTIYQSNFNAAEFGEYVAMTYRSTTYYALKELTDDNLTFDTSVTSNRAFYYDGSYVGFLHDFTPEDDDTTTTPIYVSLEDVTKITVPAGVNMITNPSETNNTTSFSEDYTTDAIDFTEYEDYLRFERDGITYYVSKSNVNYTVREGAKYYTCSITFQPNTNSYTSGSYKLSQGSQYYSQRTDYVSRNEYGQGSIYVSGLTDEDGNEVELSYEKVLSTEWTTFYFFIATGDTEQTVNIELWLGAKSAENVSTIESTGVVFFDEVKVQRYSENYFYDTYFDYLENKEFEIGYENENGNFINSTEYSTVKFANLNSYNEIELGDEFNFDFEDTDITALKGFKKTAGSGNAQIVGLNKDAFEHATGKSYAGSNLNVYENIEADGSVTITENNQALALWADDNYVEVTSTNGIPIDLHKMYKITVDYKLIDVTGTAYLKIQENDSVINNYGLNESFYTLSDGSVSGTSNGSSNFNNSYNTLTIYVKGSDLYNSELDLTLALGSSDESATGCVVFDDIRVEEVTFAEFEEAENSVELGVLSTSPSIENGYFNSTENTDFDFPLTPASWTIEEGSGLTYSGVFNTKSEEYQKYQEKALEYEDESDNPYLWATYGNPKDSNNSNTNSNNVLMVANLSPSYQTVTSPTFTINANSYYKLNFKYFTRSIDPSDLASFKLSVYTDQDVLLFEDENVLSSNAWEDYSVYFQTFEGAENVYVVIEFGTSTDLKLGLVYFDNFELETIDSTVYNSLPDTANKVDMTDYYLNLPTNVITDDIYEFSSDAYTGSSNTENSVGGIVTDNFFVSNGLDDFLIEKENEDDEIKLFYIRTNTATSHTIESLYNFDLTSGNYYKLSFMLKTKFVYNGSNGDEDFDINEQTYGATVGLTGFDYMTELKSNDEYQEYTLYIHATEDTTAHLYIALVSDHALTTGSMVVYNVNFEDISTDDDSEPQEYTTAQEAIDSSDYDINSNRVAIGEATDTEDDDSGDDSTEEDTSDDTSGNDYTWLLYVSSIITALAIIVAIVGYYLRKIKIKKIETKRKETYDRKGSLHRDVLRQEAEQERAKEIEKLEQDIKKFESELENIEKEHKEKVVKLRKEENKVVSKSTEKEFKLFAQKRDVLTEKIDILKHQLENVKSPEYLLSLERKKFMESEAKQKQLDKESKMINKKKEEEKKAKENKKNKK